MPVVVIANPKGGVGKSTLATNVAGYYAHRGHAVMLGDADRQQSSRLWLGLRPAAAAPIRGWDIDAQGIAKPPKGSTHVVLDTAGGLHGKKLDAVLAVAQKLLVPLAPSVFDLFATRAFLDEVAARKHGRRLQLGLVGMRVDARTLAAAEWHRIVEQLGVPVVAELRPTQNYVQLAARGLTLFDVAPHKVERDLAQWEPLARWLDA